MTPMLRRVLTEKRALAVPLAALLVANVLAYAFVVRPRGIKAAGAADRAFQAAAARRTESVAFSIFRP